MVVSAAAESVVSWSEFQVTVGYPPEAQAQTEALLTAATAQIEAYCGRVFREAVHEETYDGYGDGVTVLREWPVHEVEQIWVDRRRVFGDDMSVDRTLWTHDEGCLYLREDLAFPAAPGIVKVRYRAGYAEGNVPADVRTACMELVMWRRQRIQTRQVGVVDVVSLIRGSGKTTFEADLPSSVREILTPYVRRY